MKVCLACQQRFADLEWRCPRCGWKPARLGGVEAFAPELAAANDGFSEDYFARLAELEPGNFWFRARNRLLIWALRTYFPSAQSLLELGCGTGYVLAGMRQAFPQMQLAGSEIFLEGLTFARRRLAGVSFFQGDAGRLPFADEFDVVGAFDVLEHVADDQAVLEQMVQALRPGGGLLLTVPQHRWLWSALDDYSFHKRRYTRAELVDKVRRAGGVVLRVTSFVSLLLPFMAFSRLRKRARVSDPAGELRLPPVLDVALEMILQAERRMIEAGVSFPVGGSLLIVAARQGAYAGYLPA